MRGSVSEDLGDPELRRSLPALADYMEEASIHLAHHSVDLEQTDGKRFFGTAPSCEANDQTEGLRHEAVWACRGNEPDYADEPASRSLRFPTSVEGSHARGRSSAALRDKQGQRRRCYSSKPEVSARRLGLFHA